MTAEEIQLWLAELSKPQDKRYWKKFPRGAVIDGKWVGWSKIRRIVWDRDGSVCAACGDIIDYSVYECSHKIDRLCGGSDHPDNLAVMCNLCNRLKDITENMEQYNYWLSHGTNTRTLIESLFHGR